MTPPDTCPYWLADLLDPAAADDQGSGVRRRGLLGDIADHLHTDVVLIGVAVGMVLAVLGMALGSWLFSVSTLAVTR